MKDGDGESCSKPQSCTGQVIKLFSDLNWVTEKNCIKSVGNTT